MIIIKGCLTVLTVSETYSIESPNLPTYKPPNSPTCRVVVPRERRRTPKPLFIVGLDFTGVVGKRRWKTVDEPNSPTDNNNFGEHSPAFILARFLPADSYVRGEPRQCSCSNVGLILIEFFPNK